MAKSQVRGNKEAKKPKQPPKAPAPPAGGIVPKTTASSAPSKKK